MSASAVVAETLHRVYPGGTTAVRAVSLRVAPGEVLGVCGRSGSGKSTLLRLLAGLERPDSGRLLLGGAPVWPESGRSAGPRLPRPGWVMPVFQNARASLDPRWPLWRIITEPLTVGPPGRAVPERARLRELAAAELERVGLGQLDPLARPGSLSTGQCQRVAIVRALVAGPGLVVADEPTASLDLTTAAGVTRLLRQAADAGSALVVVGHDVDRLAVLADRVVRMVDGALTEQGG